MEQFNFFHNICYINSLCLIMGLEVTYNVTYLEETSGLGSVFGTVCAQSAEAVYFSVNI